MHKTTYGLMDRTSGRYVRLDTRSNEGEDFCEAETVEMTLDPHGPRMEISQFRYLVRLLRSDTEWYASSRERPMWGRIDLDNCIPVVFQRREIRLIPDGDPITIEERTNRVILPPMLNGRAIETRRDAPRKILERILHDTPFIDRFEYEASIIDLGDHVLEHQTIFDDDHRNLAQTINDVAVPEDWPCSRSGELDLTDPRYRLILHSPDVLGPASIRNLADTDFTPAPSTPGL